MSEQLPSGLHLPTGASAGAERLTVDREARRDRPVWLREAVGPWQGRVTVTRVEAVRKRRGEHLINVQWEVGVQWTGPPMVGTGAPATEVGARADAFWTPDPGLAHAVARAAEDDLRRPRVPDLRTLARLLG